MFILHASISHLLHHCDELTKQLTRISVRNPLSISVVKENHISEKARNLRALTTKVIVSISGLRGMFSTCTLSRFHLCNELTSSDLNIVFLTV